MAALLVMTQTQTVAGSGGKTHMQHLVAPVRSPAGYSSRVSRRREMAVRLKGVS